MNLKENISVLEKQLPIQQHSIFTHVPKIGESTKTPIDKIIIPVKREEKISNEVMIETMLY